VNDLVKPRVEEVMDIRLPEGWVLAHSFFLGVEKEHVIIQPHEALDFSLEFHRIAGGIVETRSYGRRLDQIKVSYQPEVGDWFLDEVQRPTYVDDHQRVQKIGVFRRDGETPHYEHVAMTLNIYVPG
jgi:hypothetical protein